MKTTWSYNHRILGFWDQILSNFASLCSIAHCLINSAGNGSCVPTNPLKRAGNMVNYKNRVNAVEKEKFYHHGKTWKGGMMSLGSFKFMLSKYSASNFRKQCNNEERLSVSFWILWSTAQVLNLSLFLAFAVQLGTWLSSSIFNSITYQVHSREVCVHLKPLVIKVWCLKELCWISCFVPCKQVL